MNSKLRQWVSFALLTVCLPVFSWAETDVADYNKGGSVELVKGAFNPREPLQNLIEPNPARTRVVINSFPGFTFRVGFFKELQIDRITLLPFKDDRNSAAKDIVITTSSGKVIPATLTDTGWSHYWKGIAPTPQSITVDDKCSWIKIEILNTYERGAAYGAIYKLQAFTSEDVSPYFTVTYNANKPKYLMRSIYEPENAATVNADAVTDGQPVLVTGFPRLIWSDEDVKYYQKMIAENKFAKKAWNDLLAACDSYMKKGYEIPAPENNDYTKTSLHEKNADQITALATAQILSGNKKPEYAKRAIEMLEKYSEVYASYGPTANPTLKHDTSKATWQRLNEAMWGIRLAIAYDFLMNDPSVFTSVKAQRIADKLLRPIAMEIGRGNVFDAMTNWSSYDCTAVYMIGRLLDDQKFINWGKYGWAGTPGGKPGAGLISKIRDGIDEQGLWAEPSPGYVKMATAALVTGCEAAWHAGENWYALGGGNIQRMLEASSLLATPGNFIPALGDSGTLPIEEDYYTPHIEQVAYRSQNKANLQQMLAVRKTFTLQFRFQTILPSRDFSMYSASESEPMQSGFFPGLGYAIAREGSGADGKYLLFDVNAAKSHGHPDKLQILYYNHGRLILNDQGSVFYDKPDYVNWYSKTPVHNTVSVNMQSMKKDAPVLEIFGSAGKIHVFSGAAPTAYPGCTLERTTLLLDGTVLDVYRVDTLAAGDISYNLHFADGKLTKAPPGEGPKGSPATFFSGTPFNMLTDQKKHTAGENSVFEWDCGNSRAVRYVVETAKSELISGKGIKPVSSPDDFVVVRRKEFTHFFSAIDAFTGTPRVESVRTIPVKNKDLFAGAIQYTDGSKGWLLINYSNEPEKPVTDGSISLQGRLAYSEQDKNGKLSRAIYIGDGGEAVMGKEINIAASGPCMVFVDRYADGFYTAQNVNNRGAGEVALEVPLSLPAGAKNYATDEKGKRTGAGDLRAPAANGRMTVQLKNFNSHELTGNPKSIAEITAEKRREKITQEKADNKKRLTANIAELSALYEKAAKLRPEGAVVLKPAEEIDSEIGGKASVSKEKDRQGLMARAGGTGLASIFQWNDGDHSISWKVTVPSTGYYTLALKYCSDGAPCRSFAIDGKPLPETVRELSFDQTGGFSRNEDQWAVAIVADPDFKIPYPLLLEKGEHVITLNAVRNSMNVDYLALLDYRLQATREAIEGGKKNLLPEPDFKALRETYLSE